MLTVAEKPRRVNLRRGVSPGSFIISCVACSAPSAGRSLFCALIALGAYGLRERFERLRSVRTYLETEVGQVPFDLWACFLLSTSQGAPKLLGLFGEARNEDGTARIRSSAVALMQTLLQGHTSRDADELD